MNKDQLLEIIEDMDEETLTKDWIREKLRKLKNRVDTRLRRPFDPNFEPIARHLQVAGVLLDGVPRSDHGISEVLDSVTDPLTAEQISPRRNELWQAGWVMYSGNRIENHGTNRASGMGWVLTPEAERLLRSRGLQVYRGPHL